MTDNVIDRPAPPTGERSGRDPDACRAKFHAAIHLRCKVVLIWQPRTSNDLQARIVAPLDVGPRKQDTSGTIYLHGYMYPGAREKEEHGDAAKPHVASIPLDAVSDVRLLVESEFNPAEIVTWRPITWHVPRDWQAYSGEDAVEPTMRDRFVLSIIHRNRVRVTFEHDGAEVTETVIPVDVRTLPQREGEPFHTVYTWWRLPDGSRPNEFERGAVGMSISDDLVKAVEATSEPFTWDEVDLGRASVPRLG